MTDRPVYRKEMPKSERAHWLRAFKWAKRYNVANGLYYDDPLFGASGIWVTFFIFPGTSNRTIEQAMHEVLGKRDVVGFTLLAVPAGFGGHR